MKKKIQVILRRNGIGEIVCSLDKNLELNCL